MFRYDGDVTESLDLGGLGHLNTPYKRNVYGWVYRPCACPGNTSVTWKGQLLACAPDTRRGRGTGRDFSSSNEDPRPLPDKNKARSFMEKKEEKPRNEDHHTRRAWA